MSIEKSYFRERSFVIETYSYGENDKPDDEDFCWRDQIDRKLRPIRACSGRIRLREITDDERKQIRDYQNERSKFLLLSNRIYSIEFGIPISDSI